MKFWNRREVLTTLGLGTAGLLVSRPATKRAQPAANDGLAEFAERLRQTPRAEVFSLAAKAIAAGADFQTLIGAAFIAGVQEIRPRPLGGKLHTVLMAESAFQLAAMSLKCEAWLMALWCLDNFKDSQEQDRAESDWTLPPRSAESFTGAGQARREFAAAMEAWDAERADRAVTGVLRFHQLDTLFELLWPFAARCYVDAGHKIIFCAQLARVLRRLDWRYAEPAVRSLVSGLLNVSRDGRPATAAYDRSRELAAKFPDSWLKGHEDAAKSEDLLRQFRACDSAQAQDLVLAAFKEGLGAATVWDGLRLYASELFHRRPRATLRRHFPVHGVTEVNAFHHAWRAAKNETTKRLLILQAAGWLPLLRDDFVRAFGPLEGDGLDMLGASSPGKSATLEQVFAQCAPDEAHAWLERGPKNAAAYLTRLRGCLADKAGEDHQFKYLAALHEESALAQPRWATRLLAPAITYLPSPADPDTEVRERSLHALRKAGIG
jgi:hypothetical protein